MRRPLLVLVLALVAVPALALAHPATLDPHHSCATRVPVKTVSPHFGGLVVQGTLSHLDALGTSLPCTAGYHNSEFGSHAGPCLAVGTIPGAYCGPIVPPGGTATCAWRPIVNTVPTVLVIGLEFTGNGLVRLPEGEKEVYGPLPTLAPQNMAWRVVNPFGAPARVIGFPTNGALPPNPSAGLHAPLDQNEVRCVTP